MSDDIDNQASPPILPRRKLVDEGGTLPKVELKGALKPAVHAVIDSLADDEFGDRFCLYVLRVADNPAILEADVHFIQSKEASKRQRRTVWEKIKSTVILLIGLAITAIASYAFAFVGSIVK